MGVIAWIVLGMIVGLIAEKLPGDQHSPVVITLIGVAGALLGGWLASKAFHVASLQRFFDPSTWITTMADALLTLVAFHLTTRRRAVQQTGSRP